MVRTSAATVTFALLDGYELRATQPGTVEVSCPGRVMRLKQLDAGVAAALGRLADGPVDVPELEKIAIGEHPGADLDRLREELDRLVRKPAAGATLVVAGVELLRATARSTLTDLDLSLRPPTGSVCLSRFAFARRADGGLILESPVAHVSVRFLDLRLGALVSALAAPGPVEKLAERLPTLSSATVDAALAFLAGVGVLVAVDGSGVPEDESRPDLVQREFHDVLAHAASRRGLTDRPLGGTFRFQGKLPPAPALKPLPGGDAIPLPRPDLDAVEARDPSLTRVLESRRSIRKHGTAALSVAELGEFLFRVARATKVYGIDEKSGAMYETSRRPYPSGGACYDLELYVTSRMTAGLAPGVYHYDPGGHRLTQVCRAPDLIRSMLLEACLASRSIDLEEPQLLITLASRFARLSWKYESIAYATTLKNVGVLYQTMYLVATAMGLAPCALGAGDSALFQRVTGLDPTTESSVGEFMLGHRTEA